MTRNQPATCSRHSAHGNGGTLARRARLGNRHGTSAWEIWFSVAGRSGGRLHDNWKSTDGVSGTINATAPDGATFAGRFLQITSDTRVDTLGPSWDGWGPDWRRGGWAYWDPGPDFATRYTGKVLADLSAADGRHMRCKFQLVYLSDGMAGGGAGECRLPGGKTIEATFPKAS